MDKESANSVSAFSCVSIESSIAWRQQHFRTATTPTAAVANIRISKRCLSALASANARGTTGGLQIPRQGRAVLEGSQPGRATDFTYSQLCDGLECVFLPEDG
jgi:hypothetical protein